MANPAVSLRFGTQALLIGDGDSDEEFSAPCGLTSITLNSNITTNTTEQPDCDDPDAPVWLLIDETSRQFTVEGGGLLARQYNLQWKDWMYEGGFKNVRWFTNLNSIHGGGFFEGPALLTTYQEVGARNQRWQVNIGITFDGRPTRVTGI